MFVSLKILLFYPLFFKFKFSDFFTKYLNKNDFDLYFKKNFTIFKVFTLKEEKRFFCEKSLFVISIQILKYYNIGIQKQNNSFTLVEIGKKFNHRFCRYHEIDGKLNNLL